MDGPEKGAIPLNPPAAPRVSTSRQGVIATKISALVDKAPWEDWDCGTALAPAEPSAWLGCQYSGAAQFFSGTWFSFTLWPLNNIGTRIIKDTARCEYLESPNLNAPLR
jgi:hypothetical protein